MGTLIMAKRRAREKLKTARDAITFRVSRQAALDRAAAATRLLGLKQVASPRKLVLQQAVNLPKPTSSKPPLRLPNVPGPWSGRATDGNAVLGRHAPRSLLQLRNQTTQQPQLFTRLGHLMDRREQQPCTVTVSRRQIKKLGKSRFGIDASIYGDIDSLSSLLGLTGKQTESAVLIAIDTESERHCGVVGVVEIGIAILDTRDIRDLHPGDHIRNWTPRIRHHHLVLDTTRKPNHRMRVNSSMFGKSQFVSPKQAATLLRSILLESTQWKDQANARPEVAKPGFERLTPRVCLVGQSINTDVAAIRAPPLNINLHDASDVGVSVTSIFDTYAFTETARAQRKDHPTTLPLPGRLGPLVAYLGADPRYITSNGMNVSGTHNAGNDAAYTMMALLLYALRWKEIVRGVVLSRGIPATLVEKEPHRTAGGYPTVPLAGTAFVVGVFISVHSSLDLVSSIL